MAAAQREVFESMIVALEQDLSEAEQRVDEKIDEVYGVMKMLLRGEWELSMESQQKIEKEMKAGQEKVEEMKVVKE